MTNQRKEAICDLTVSTWPVSQFYAFDALCTCGVSFLISASYTRQDAFLPIKWVGLAPHVPVLQSAPLPK